MARPDPATIDIRMRSSQFQGPDEEDAPTTPVSGSGLEAKPEEEPMTEYTERRQAGYYDAPDAEAPEQPTAEEDNGPSLAELRAQAEALDLPTYGTKAQIAERIANAGNEQSDEASDDAE
jgi:hypothetical protein